MPFRDLAAPADGEGSVELRARVVAAREVQGERFHKTRIYANAQMPPKLIKQHCAPGPEAQRLLEVAMERLGLSARAYHRILKMARTIADLEGEEAISPGPRGRGDPVPDDGSEVWVIGNSVGRESETHPAFGNWRGLTYAAIYSRLCSWRHVLLHGHAAGTPPGDGIMLKAGCATLSRPTGFM